MKQIVDSTKELGTRAWDSFSYFMNEIGQFIPKLLGALLFWFIGRFIARLFRKMIIKFVKFIKIDAVAEKVELDQMLEQIGVKHQFSTIIGNVIYYVLLLVVLLSVFDILGLTVAKELFNNVVGLIPDIFISIILFVFGLYLANFVRDFINIRLSNMKIEQATTIGSLAKSGILFIVFSMILSQLNIGNDLISKLTQYLFAALGLGLAIAIGLGGKDVAKELLERFFKLRK
ncbi:MAG: mechanosensitive ion channel family protein [Flavobacteriaceae bacterium]